MDHQVNETEPQERTGGDVAFWAGDGLPGRRRGERLRLVSRRLDHGSDCIISELITCEHGPSLVAINACQQQRGEAVPNHDVLNQLAYRDLRRRRPIPCVRGQLTHDPFELRRRCVDQLHVPQASAGRGRPGRTNGSNVIFRRRCIVTPNAAAFTPA